MKQVPMLTMLAGVGSDLSPFGLAQFPSITYIIIYTDQLT